MSVKRIYFKTSIEQPKGYNVTLRSGEKHQQLVGGDAIELWAADDQTKIGDAVVSFVTEFGDLESVPAWLLEKSFNPASRTHAGMHQALLEAYGPQYEDDVLTLVCYFV